MYLEAIPGASGNRKGKVGERLYARKAREEWGWPEAKTTREVNGGAFVTDFGADLQNTPPYKIQIKKRKQHVWIGTINEIKCGPSDVPLLISHADYQEPMVVIPLKHWEQLRSDSVELAELRRASRGTISSPSTPS